VARRHLIPVPAMNFDTRPRTLSDEIRPDWDESVKEAHRQNYANLIASLSVELGPVDFLRKLHDFKTIGVLPFSIVAHHNVFYDQIRKSFVQGYYYPALTSACSLEERILNHLVLDLRDNFADRKTYSKIANLSSIQSWQIAINVLVDWNVLLPDAASAFRKLEGLRQRSLHFSESTYQTLRDDAVRAIGLLSKIIEAQFPAAGTQSWFVRGTKGASFISAPWQDDPFVKKYYLPLCPLVSIHYVYSFENGKWLLFDFKECGDEAISDEEFCQRYNERDPSSLAPTTWPPANGIVCYDWSSRMRQE
jgi:hypothetical protein